jgi:hypothetical protein
MPIKLNLPRLILMLVLLVASTSGLEAKKAGIPGSFYRLQSAVTLPGASPDWDYLAYDVPRHRLFIARRGAGLWAFDTRAHRIERLVLDTLDAGAAVLVPELERGFTTNEDGSTTVFNLKTLQPIQRIKFAEDGDAASYDAVTGRIAFISAESRLITFMDARSLKTLGHLVLESEKLDASVADGGGAFLINERDRNMVAKVDARTMKILAEWPTVGCSQPTGLAINAADHRAFIGCRGAVPVLAVIDTADGHIVTTLPLGRGNDGVVWDAARKQILATNGIDANIVVYRQIDPDHYRMEQAIATRPNARTIAFDPDLQKIFTVTAEGVVNPSEPINTGPSQFYPNAYYDNSFVVLTYGIGPHR